jgi:CRISPR-associated protein (TIGR02584 family)
MTKKNILLAVTGLSPQVVTETLFGIVEAGIEWPDEIQIITTKRGKEQARLGLIVDGMGKQSLLEKFCYDYQRKLPILTENTIFVVPDANGGEVDDARTYEDQEALADFIVSHVARLCGDPNIQLHASLAGGRKTMTFFLGYAMTLFSRIGDRLSHVLVDEVFEGNRDFYYPTPYTNVINGRGVNEKLDTSRAKVILAEIPFIRQRQQLHKNTIKSLENESYRDLTMYQNAVNELSSVHITINLLRRTISIMGKVIDFAKNPMALAFYSMIAYQIKENGYSAIMRPKADEQDKFLTNLFLQEMEKIAGIEVQNFSELLMANDIKSYYDRFKQRAIKLTEADLVRGVGIEDESDIAPTYDMLKAGMDVTFFSDRLTQLKKHLEEQFPKDFVHCIMPGQVYQQDNMTQKRTYSTSNQQATPYGLWLDVENIHYQE